MYNEELFNLKILKIMDQIMIIPGGRKSIISCLRILADNDPVIIPL